MSTIDIFMLRFMILSVDVCTFLVEKARYCSKCVITICIHSPFVFLIVFSFCVAVAVY